MLNAGVLALHAPAGPLARLGLGSRRRFVLTKTLEWNLYWGVLDPMWDDDGVLIRQVRAGGGGGGGHQAQPPSGTAAGASSSARRTHTHPPPPTPLPQEWLQDEAGLNRRLRLLAAANLAVAPFLLLFLIIYFTMKVGSCAPPLLCDVPALPEATALQPQPQLFCERPLYERYIP